VILVDTGAFVALFDPQDGEHERCKSVLEGIQQEKLCTTVPVLTEAFHMLSPDSRGAASLREFVLRGGAVLFFLDSATLSRAFELMEQYADHPMDLADASLIVAAEELGTSKVFTIDFRDFSAYRIRRGHGHEAVKIVA